MFWNLFAMLKQGMDQVDINYEWHRGAQLNQGKRASNSIRLAMIPLLLHLVINSGKLA